MYTLYNVLKSIVLDSPFSFNAFSESETAFVQYGIRAGKTAWFFNIFIQG